MMMLFGEDRSPFSQFRDLEAIRYYSSGAAVSLLSVPTHNAGVVGSTPPCVTFKTPLVREATGNYVMKSISLE